MATIDALLETHGKSLVIILVGLLTIGGGIFLSQSAPTVVEVIPSKSPEASSSGSLIVAVEGAVKNPGVYEFALGDRIESAIEKAGGYSDDADSEWVGKSINRAAKLSDGMKIYIKSLGEQLDVSSASKVTGVYGASDEQSAGESSSININTASQKDLESLDGIGQSYAQKIIDHRPYSDVDELVSKGAITQKLLDKNRAKLAI